MRLPLAGQMTRKWANLVALGRCGRPRSRIPGSYAVMKARLSSVTSSDPDDFMHGVNCTYAEVCIV